MRREAVQLGTEYCTITCKSHVPVADAVRAFLYFRTLIDESVLHLVEVRGQSELIVGENATVELFEPGEKVKVSGISHGKGFAGTIKRHNFKRGPKTHGSHNIRAPGSIGQSATPSRVFKGVRMAGRMGGKRVTQVGLVVHDVDAERNLLLVKGAVPCPKNGFVQVREESR